MMTSDWLSTTSQKLNLWARKDSRSLTQRTIKGTALSFLLLILHGIHSGFESQWTYSIANWKKNRIFIQWTWKACRVKVLRWKTTCRSTRMCSQERADWMDNSPLEIDKNIQPVQLPTRRVPIALRELLKQELDRLSNIGVIRKVATPTEWVSAVVVTAKTNGKVSLCTDPKPLN